MSFLPSYDLPRRRSSGGCLGGSRSHHVHLFPIGRRQCDDRRLCLSGRHPGRCHGLGTSGSHSSLCRRADVLQLFFPAPRRNVHHRRSSELGGTFCFSGYLDYGQPAFCAREAPDRQQEMERLYAVSRAILLTDTSQPVAKQIAHQIAQIFQFPAAALYDRNSGEIHRAGPEDLPDIDDKLREAALQGTLFQNQASQVTVTAIRLGGEPIGSLAVRGPLLSDTALQSLSNLVAIGLEKVRAQEAASRAEVARQSEELKSTLLDAIAHEFKTPLTSVKAATTALLADPVAQSQQQRELVTIIDEEADHLARLVTEAIQMARIEGGKLQLNRELHPPASLISVALQQMKPLIESKRVDVEIPDNLPLVFVDAELVQLAIRQLIDNALKYSPPPSSLTIGARAAENSVIVSMADQGPGIPEEELSRIFEKFYRSSSGRQRVPGTGVGLSIAREILRAHGGDLSVKSTLGRGSEFYLSLPAASQEKIA